MRFYFNFTTLYLPTYLLKNERRCTPFEDNSLEYFTIGRRRSQETHIKWEVVSKIYAGKETTQSRDAIQEEKTIL